MKLDRYAAVRVGSADNLAPQLLAGETAELAEKRSLQEDEVIFSVVHERKNLKQALTDAGMSMDQWRRACRRNDFNARVETQTALAAVLASSRALKVLNILLENPNPKIKLDAAKTILASNLSKNTFRSKVFEAVAGAAHGSAPPQLEEVMKELKLLGDEDGESNTHKP